MAEAVVRFTTIYKMKVTFYSLIALVILTGISAEESNDNFKGDVALIKTIHSALAREDFTKILPAYKDLVKKEEDVTLPPSYLKDVYFKWNASVYQALEAFIVYIEQPTNEAKNDFISNCTDLEKTFEDLARPENSVVDLMLNFTDGERANFLSGMFNYMTLMSAGFGAYIPYSLLTGKEPTAIAKAYAAYIDATQFLMERIHYELYNEFVNQMLYDHLAAQREFNDSVVSLTSAAELNSQFPGPQWMTLVLQDSQSKDLFSPDDDSSQSELRDSRICDAAFSDSLNTAVVDHRRILAFSSATFELNEYPDEARIDLEMRNANHLTAHGLYEYLAVKPNRRDWANRTLAGNNTIIVYKNGCLGGISPSGYYQTETRKTVVQPYSYNNFTVIFLPARTDNRPVPTRRSPDKPNEKAYDLILNVLPDLKRTEMKETKRNQSSVLEVMREMSRMFVSENSAGCSVAGSLKMFLCLPIIVYLLNL